MKGISDMSPDLSYLIKLAKGAGDILMDGYLREHDIQHKGRIDLVTEMDKKSEDHILSSITKNFSGHTIVSEESGLIDGSEEHCWYVDPLDGTSNYAHGVPIFCVTLAYAYKGQMQLAVTYDPTRDQCFSAKKGKGSHLNNQPIHVSTVGKMIDAMLVTGFPCDDKNPYGNNLDLFAEFMEHALSVRRLGSAALDIAYVAAGWIDGYWEIGIHPWDIAAGTLLVQEAGGVITDLKGSENYFTEPYAMIAANPLLHPKILNIIQSDNTNLS